MNCPEFNFPKFRNDFRYSCNNRHMICKECVENLMNIDVNFCPLCNHEDEPLLNIELNNEPQQFFNNIISNRLDDNEYIINYINNDFYINYINNDFYINYINNNNQININNQINNDINNFPSN